MGCLRHPYTTQERRRWYSDIERVKEYPELHLRARRSAHRLPSLYDDIPKLNGDDRSWKKHRDKQWNVVRSTKPKTKGCRGEFDTPDVLMNKYPHYLWGRGQQAMFPYRVRFKYIKNKTA